MSAGRGGDGRMRLASRSLIVEITVEMWGIFGLTMLEYELTKMHLIKAPENR